MSRAKSERVQILLILVGGHILQIVDGFPYLRDAQHQQSDHSLRADDVRYPTQDQEFVLYHIDGVEATGFISHLKLPHYVTFQSKLDAALRSIAEPEKGDEADA